MLCWGEFGSLHPGLSTMHCTNALWGLTGMTCFTILCAFSIEPRTVQCWIQLDGSTRFDVEFNSTCYFSVLCWLSLSSCHLVVVFIKFEDLVLSGKLISTRLLEFTRIIWTTKG